MIVVQLIGWTLSVSAIVMAIAVSVGCSSTSERFDHRPPICKDLGKRGREC